MSKHRMIVLVTVVIGAVLVAGVSAVPTDGGRDVGATVAEQVDSERNGTRLSFLRQVSDGRTVVIDRVVLPSGGFVAIHDESLEPPDPDPVGSVIGVSQYLPRGSHSNVTVTLAEPVNRTASNRVIAMVHNDTDRDALFDYVVSNGSADGALERDGSVVTDPATLDLRENVPPQASVRFDNQTINDSTVLLESTTLSAGGFVSISDEEGEILGVSPYLPAKTWRTLRIDLEELPNGTGTLVARAHLDTDGDRVFGFDIAAGGVDTPYPSEQGTPTDEARVRVSQNGTETGSSLGGPAAIDGS